MYKIMIDPGHGGKDPGAVNGTRTEKADVLRLSLLIGAKLTAAGLVVSYTRTRDTYPTLPARTAAANSWGADLFVSVHRNAAAASAAGTEVLVYSKSSKAASLAADLCARYAALGFKDRGVKERPGLAVLKGSKMPAILIEAGFISNAGDNTLYDAKIDTIATETAASILSFFGIKQEPAKPPAAAKWVKEGDRWWYRNPDGSYPAEKWQKINGRWYLFDKSGWMLTGPQKDKGKWYFLNPEKDGTEGACMRTDSSGAMVDWRE